MNPYKRLLCIILCISILSSLAGCGQADSAAATAASEEPPAQATQAAVDSYLAIAQGFIDKEDFDSAIAVLEQASELWEDSRIADLLEQIEDMRSTLLDVVVSQEPVNLRDGAVTIHSVAAWERHDGFVEYSVDYTATEGLYIWLKGDGLDYECNFTTSGSRETFVFEIPSEQVRAMDKEFRLFIGLSMDNAFFMDLVTNWPDDIRTAATPIPLQAGSLPVMKGCEIHSVSVHALDETRLYYNVDYTAPMGAMHVEAKLDNDVPFFVCGTESGRAQFAFIADRKAVESAKVLQISIRENENGTSGAAVELLLDSYTLPPAQTADPVGELKIPDYNLHHTLKGYEYQLTGCTAQILGTGFVHYQIGYVAEEGVSSLSHGFTHGSIKIYPVIGVDGTASGTAEIYVPLEDVYNSTEVKIRFSGRSMRENYELSIPNTWINQNTDGNPVGSAQTLPFDFWANPDPEKYDFHGCTAQPLDNGWIRFTFSYNSPEHLDCYLLDNTNSLDLPFSSGATPGQQNVTLDLPADTYAQDNKILFRANLYNDRNGRVNYMAADIDASSVLSGGRETMTMVSVNVLAPAPVKIQSGTSENPIDAITRKQEEEANALTTTPEIDLAAAMAVDTSMIQLLEVSQKPVTPKAQDGIQPYADFYSESMPKNADISDNPALAYSLIFSDRTEFSSNMPASYDPKALMEWGKAPGLNVDVLHQLGYTGKGAVIAYIDQPISDHPEYSDCSYHNTNNTDRQRSMHGYAVMSMLAGKEIGTAPDAEVYFYGYASWHEDQAYLADCFYQIIEQNKSLPEGEKITMVGLSTNILDYVANVQALRDAVKACEEAGIMVWFCGEYAAAAFTPFSDRNNYDNVIRDGLYGNLTPDLVHVPAGSRTSATGEHGKYIYWGSGGLSWTMPYVLGIYAIVAEIDPSLTQDDLRKMIVETAYAKDGMKIINPVEFVATALEGVGRTEDAAELRSAAEANTRYTYAVMNRQAMTPEDLAAAESYLKEISDSQVLVVDASGITGAQQLYTILQADHIRRGGKVAGIQIFGNADLIPSFEIGYRVQMDSGVDDMGFLLTDLFYGNFNNQASDLSKAYNVMDHFDKGLQVQLVPEWKVARLPLAKGEFAPFFEKYMDFAETAGLGRQALVNFSNPIFANFSHSDDMGYFMNRLDADFGIDLGDYRLYGNQLGQYPVNTHVLGGFTAENLISENRAGVREFIINTHGQRNVVDKCWYENGSEKREPLMTTGNINAVLCANPYYLDTWTCNNGEGMKDNITTAALQGKCVGMFSITHIISNNGVSNQAPLKAMAESNFYWFYLNYLKALSEGMSRSDAFFEAQKAYGNALIVDSQNGIRGEGNYQFNLYNLLGYHNFGIIEPNHAFSCIHSTVS